MTYEEISRDWWKWSCILSYPGDPKQPVSWSAGWRPPGRGHVAVRGKATNVARAREKLAEAVTERLKEEK